MKLLAVLVAAAALALGQGRTEAPVPGRFEMLLSGRDGVSGMTVVLQDGTGLVRAMTAGGRSTRGGSITSVTGRGDAVVVEWLSGRCDDHTHMTLRPAEGGYELTAVVISTPFHGGDVCMFLDGIGRSVTLVFAAPIAAESVAFELVR